MRILNRPSALGSYRRDSTVVIVDRTACKNMGHSAKIALYTAFEA